LKHKLSIIIACYNEEKSITKILARIEATELINGTDREIIIVNDASTDQTAAVIEKYVGEMHPTPIQVYHQEKNSGKGSCIHLGIEKATGSLIIIQDADLEYDPSDYNRMLRPILEEKADVVYGSRFTGGEPHRVLFFLHTIGNRMLTLVSNLCTNINLTDMETGYKMFRAEILKKINLREKRFGFEPEVTAKISRVKGVRIYEVGISYFGRTYEEGKKINWKDGMRAIYCIIKYNIFSRR
jgi:glycosyltransferase involved in cell wall biosynthesis